MKKIEFTILYAGLLAVLTACGGVSEQAEELLSDNDSGNEPPSISGVPARNIAQGESYSFVPVVSDPDEDDLTFSVTNKPSWLTFNPSTGGLEGVPAEGDVGVYSNVRLSVSDGQSVAALSSFSITVTVEQEQNTSPQISGSPAEEVREGETYSFVPTVVDEEGDALTFIIENKPAWLVFDDETGELSGVPGAEDVGTYADIRITVTEIETDVSVSLASFDLDVYATGGTLSWTAPVVRADDSPLPLSELGGYKIYGGVDPESLELLVDLDDPTATEYTLPELTETTHYYAITAYNIHGTESSLSNVVSKTTD